MNEEMKQKFIKHLKEEEDEIYKKIQEEEDEEELKELLFEITTLMKTRISLEKN